MADDTSTPIDWNSLPATSPQASDPNAIDFNQLPSATPEDLGNAKYATPVQQGIGALEAAARGVIGPLAPAAETALGVNPEGILGRENATDNTFSNTAANIAGLTGSALASFGLAPEARAVGEGVAALAGIGEGSTIAKIASRGVQTGAEMAALSTSDELGKMVLNDPSQTVGSAAVNIGLNGILGGIVGGGLGAISPLWESSAESVKAPSLINDAKAQYEYRMTNPDPATAAIGELQGRMQEMDSLTGMKTEPLMAALPEATPEATAKIDAHLQDISDTLTSKLEKAAKDVDLKSGVPSVAQKLDAFHDAITAPDANFATKFQALDKLKTDLQAYAKYNGSVEQSALGRLGRDMAAGIRPALEDSSVWGQAGNIQQQANKAISDFLTSNKDLVSKFTSKLGGDAVVDPNKVGSFIKQSAKGTAGLKGSVVENYLNNSNKLADTLKGIYHDAGLNIPDEVNLNPTPVLNNSLEKSTPGSKLGDWLYDKGSSESLGHGVAGGLGYLLGKPLGHGEIGAILGERLLGKTFASLAKPMLENATNHIALKSTANYLADASRGSSAIINATKALFKSSSQVIPMQLIPTAASVKELSNNIDHMAQNFQDQMKVGQNVSHYLPNHAQAAAATASSAIGYLSSLKPQQAMNSPLDNPGVVSKAAEYRYNRQLEIAQQPLMVLKHAAEGTLIPQDLTTIKTIYPALFSSIQAKVGQELIEAKSKGSIIPYKQRLGLSQILGQPLDSTMTQGALQSVINANSGAQAAAANQKTSPHPHKPSQATLNQMNKTNAMYATPIQARAEHKVQS